jgi:protoporphyrinogen oxidase
MIIQIPIALDKDYTAHGITLHHGTTIDKVSSDKTIFTNHGEFGGFDQIIWAVALPKISTSLPSAFNTPANSTPI